MIRRICLSTAALVLFAAPAFAQDKCPAPKSPSVPNGRTATAPELIAAANDVKAFIAASDDYQACLKADIDAQTEAAKADKKDMDPKVKAALVAQGDANQKEKERVGNAYNTAAQAYRAAHPAGKK
jgi:hypothetical protein